MTVPVVSPERVYQVGIRTGAREEYHRRRPHFFPMYPMLNGHPIEVVRRLLGHRSIATTLRFYAEFNSVAALRLYDTEVLHLRDELPAPPVGRRRIERLAEAC